jgi:hypothetical protein
MKKHELLWTPTYKIGLTRGEVAGDLAAIKFNFGDMKVGLRRLKQVHWLSKPVLKAPALGA